MSVLTPSQYIYIFPNSISLFTISFSSVFLTPFFQLSLAFFILFLFFFISPLSSCLTLYLCLSAASLCNSFFWFIFRFHLALRFLKSSISSFFFCFSFFSVSISFSKSSTYIILLSSYLCFSLTLFLSIFYACFSSFNLSSTSNPSFPSSLLRGLSLFFVPPPSPLLGHSFTQSAQKLIFLLSCPVFSYPSPDRQQTATRLFIT